MTISSIHQTASLASRLSPLPQHHHHRNVAHAGCLERRSTTGVAAAEASSSDCTASEAAGVMKYFGVRPSWARRVCPPAAPTCVAGAGGHADRGSASAHAAGRDSGRSLPRRCGARGDHRSVYAHPHGCLQRAGACAAFCPRLSAPLHSYPLFSRNQLIRTNLRALRGTDTQRAAPAAIKLVRKRRCPQAVESRRQESFIAAFAAAATAASPPLIEDGSTAPAASVA